MQHVLVILFLFDPVVLHALELNPTTMIVDMSSLKLSQKPQELPRAAKFDKLAELQDVSAKILAVEAEIKQAKQDIKAIFGEKKNKNGEELNCLDSELSHLQNDLLELYRREKWLEEMKTLLVRETLHNLDRVPDYESRSHGAESNQEFKFLPTSASLCTASKGIHCMSCLYNGMKPASFNLPGVVREHLNMDVADIDVQSAKLAIYRGLSRTMFPVSVAENMKAKDVIAESLPSIQKTTGIALQAFFSCNQDPRLSCNVKSSLSDFGAGFGPASEYSRPDGLIYAEANGIKCPMACYELKDTSTAPIEQTGQAFASGANIALSQKKMGLESSRIAVPLIMTNGQLYLFAAVSLLDFVPVLHILTCVLDANMPSAKEQIAWHLGKAKAFVLKQARELPAFRQADYKIPEFPRVLPFSKEKYFLKPKDKVFNRFTLLDIENGALPLLWNVYEALAGVEGAEKALGYGDFQFIGPTASGPVIVFNNLKLHGYVMGVPIDEEEYIAFSKALESLVHQIHSCGVVHVDLYPSNILWANVDGKIRVRIVDWDGAHFMNEAFSDRMIERIAVSSDNFFLDGSTVATPRNDAWHLYILSDLTKEERESLQGASAEDAPKVISAYMQCISKKREKSGAAAFMEWYKGFESRSMRRAGSVSLPRGRNLS
jgi:hypothetical protein